MKNESGIWKPNAEDHAQRNGLVRNDDDGGGHAIYCRPSQKPTTMRFRLGKLEVVDENGKVRIRLGSADAGTVWWYTMPKVSSGQP